MNALLLVLAAPALAGAPHGLAPGVEGQRGFGPPVADATGQHVALTRWDNAGLWTLDLASGAIDTVSTARGAGFHPAWSGASLRFKEVHRAGGARPTGQYAVEWEAGRSVVLESGARVAQPTGARVADLARWGAPLRDELADVDLVEVDAAGRTLAWDDDAGVLHLRGVATGLTREVVAAGHGSHPAFSSDGELVLHRTADRVVVVDVSSGVVVAMFAGRDPAWVPGAHALVYADVVTGADVGPTAASSPYTVLSSGLVTLDVDTGVTRDLLRDPALHARFPAPLGQSGDVAFVDSRTGALWRLGPAGPTRVLSAPGAAAGPPPPATSRVEVDVPYMHQLWDTPDDFDGGWSCGPTSVLQTLAKWSVLPDADITCSWPSAHTSHWGWYVPNAYSFNGYTYDAWGVAAGGDCQGAHGFICRQYGGAVWAYLVDFMNQHGVPSAQVGTDYDTVVSEVNAGYPLYASVSVLGYGHILSVRGYVTDDGAPIHTIVVNDPYGDAGTGDWGNDDGEDIVYDWPGYNNGNLEIGLSQLFTAHGTAPAEPDTGTAPVDTGTPAVDTGEPAPLDTAAPDEGPGRVPLAGERVSVDGIGGCQVAPRPTGAAGLLIALGALARRRRR